MHEIYGYGCISSGWMPRKDKELLKTRKAYQELKNTFLSEDCIYIDIIAAKYRSRTKLKKILKEAGEGDCIVIMRISSLGTTTKEIKTNYLKIYERGIGLLIPDYDSPINDNLDPLSTADWGMQLRKELYMVDGEYPQGIQDRLAVIESMEIKTLQGRAFKDRPEFFKDIYWLYENYFIAEQDAYNNRLMKIGKKLFRRLAEDYEKYDPNYYADLLDQEEMYGISEKPKRHGTIPDDYADFLQLVEGGMSIEDAANQMNYNFMNPIDYKRYYVKFLGGKKAMSQASHLRRPPFAKELTKHIVYEKDPD